MKPSLTVSVSFLNTFLRTKWGNRVRVVFPAWSVASSTISVPGGWLCPRAKKEM